MSTIYPGPRTWPAGVLPLLPTAAGILRLRIAGEAGTLLR